MEQPKALAMIICDEIIEDARTHKKSLIGIFNRIVTTRFPSTHPKMHIFFSLTNGRGIYKATLQHTYLPDLTILKEIQGEVQFANPTAILEYSFEILNMTFPNEGSYSFQLLLNGHSVIERIFEVVSPK